MAVNDIMNFTLMRCFYLCKFRLKILNLSIMLLVNVFNILFVFFFFFRNEFLLIFLLSRQYRVFIYCCGISERLFP